MDILSDNTLMLQVKAGDPGKMGLLFDRYHRPLFGFFFHLSGQKETSEDLVQNVFFRMLKYSHSFTGAGEFKTWMYHLARNIFKDHLKSSKKNVSFYPLRDFEEKFAGDQFTNDPVEKKQQLKSLETALRNLPAESFELLVLIRYQELKYQEVARILDISEGAVKVRIHRVMKELKNHFLKVH